MNASWTWRLRFLRRHLTMLLVAFCVLILQSQLVIASHHCELSPLGDSAMLQHLEHQTMKQTEMKTPLCEKHCVPENSPKPVEQPPVIALPASTTLALVDLPCEATMAADWTLKPPAAGPPATIRFCRFRE
ncbi:MULTISPECIES: DUF2946 domain-containing protein [Enterobacterales]|uniref:DUF2946 domain-containing protein n=1 Tax=Enterobacterales TaxID=91347 RepID=UPI002ED96AF7